MVFTNIQPFPTVMTPITNISPLTYRDASTFLEYLETIKEWVNETLVTDSNSMIANAVAEFQTGIANAEATVNAAKDGWQGQWNEWTADKAAEYLAFVTDFNAQFDAFILEVNTSLTNVNDFQETTAANAMGVVRPEEFGAKGDWVSADQTSGNGTDDTVAFQAAIDHLLANGGGTLLLTKKYLVNGTVYINQTDYQVTKPITIKGPGGQGFRTQGAAIMRQTTGDIFCVNLSPVGDKITFKSLTNNVATLTTNTAHSLTTGDIVVITGVDNTFNGSYVITSVPTANSFTYNLTAANVTGTVVNENNATVKINTLPDDETTAGFRVEGLSIIGRRTTPGVVVEGINAFTMWRVRSSFANIYAAYLDEVVNQPSAGTFGPGDNYCDQSVYTNIWVQFSTRGGLKLFLSDASTVRDFFYESPMDTAIRAIYARAAQGFKIDGFLAWHPTKPEFVPPVGSAIIDLQTCRAVEIANLHIERSQQFESMFRMRNVEGVEVHALSTYWDTRTIFRLETVKMFEVRNWYSYETRVAGTYDLHIADAQCSDIETKHCTFYDGANAYAKRSLILEKPVGQLPVTEDGLGIRHGYTKTAYKFANVSQTLNNTQQFIHADATTAQVVLTLPTTANNEGKVFTVIKADSTTNLVTVTPSGSDVIRDTRGLWTTGAPYNMAVQGYAVTVMCSSGSWYVVSQIPAQSLRTTVTWNPGTLATGASITSPEYSLSGVTLGDQIVIGATASLQGCTATAYASSTGKFQIVLTNLTGAPVALGSISWNVKDLKWP